jgi:hypothetical protein
MTTPCAIRAAAPWVALYGAHSVGPSLAESWMAAEGRAGAPALARLSVERRAAFKDLRYSTAPMRVACVVDGRNASVHRRALLSHSNSKANILLSGAAERTRTSTGCPASTSS